MNSLKHYQYIDRAKGLAILFVVIGHIWFYSINSRSCEGETSERFPFLSYFQMHLFFLLSGLVTKSVINTLKEVAIDCWKKIRTIIVPFLVFSFCYAFVEFGEYSFSFLLKEMKNGYWYLFVIFIYYIISYIFTIVNKFFCNSSLFLRLFVDFILFVLTFSPLVVLRFFGESQLNDLFSVYELVLYYPAFIFGYLLKKYNFESLILTNKWVYLFSLLIAVVPLFFTNLSSHIGHLLSIPFSIIIIHLLYTNEDTNNFLLNQLSNLGKRSLDIYVIHFFILRLFNLSWMADFLNSSNYSWGLEMIICFLFAIIVISISLIVAKILRTSDLFESLVFGGRKIR